MSVKRNLIIQYLNDFLDVTSFNDYCVNGLQLEGKKEITSVVTGVSSNLEFFKKAVEINADLIIVHHGLFWKSDPVPFALVGYQRKRVSILVNNNVNLAAYHLPLDAHPQIGNNRLICDELGIKELESFDVGYIGKLAYPHEFTDLIQIIENKIHPKPIILKSGSLKSFKIAVVSGSPGNKTLINAVQKGIDTFICGAIDEATVALAKELKVNFINAGHYNTEIWGIRALGNHLAEKFSLIHNFIDIPNSI